MKTTDAQRRAAANYEKKVEQITVRLPVGARDKLNNFIMHSDKYDSVNSMIRILLEKEIGAGF